MRRYNYSLVMLCVLAPEAYSPPKSVSQKRLVLLKSSQQMTTSLSTIGKGSLPRPPSQWAEKAFEDYGNAPAVSSEGSYGLGNSPYSSVVEEVKTELVEMGERGRDYLAQYSEGCTRRLKNVSKVGVGSAAAVGCGACGSIAAWMVLSSLAPFGFLTGAAVGCVFALTSDRVRRRSVMTRFLCAWSRVCAAAVLSLVANCSGGLRSGLRSVENRYGGSLSSARERTGELFDATAIQRQTQSVVSLLTETIHDAELDVKFKSAAQYANSAVGSALHYFGFGDPSSTKKAEADNDSVRKKKDSSEILNAKNNNTKKTSEPLSPPLKNSKSNKKQDSPQQQQQQPQQLKRRDERIAFSSPNVLYSSGSAVLRTSGENHPRGEQPNLGSRIAHKARRALSALWPQRQQQIVVVESPNQPNAALIGLVPVLSLITYEHHTDIAKFATFVARVLTAAYNGAIIEASTAAALFS